MRRTVEMFRLRACGPPLNMTDTEQSCIVNCSVTPIIAAGSRTDEPVTIVTGSSVLSPELFHGPAVHQGVGDGELVDVLQFVAEADAAGDGGDLHVGVGAQAVHDIEEGGFALD